MLYLIWQDSPKGAQPQILPIRGKKRQIKMTCLVDKNSHQRSALTPISRNNNGYGTIFRSVLFSHFFSHFNHRSFNIWFPRHATNALGPRIPRLRGTIRVPWVVPTWKTKTPGNSVIKAIDLPSGILLIVNSYSQKFPA